METNKQVADRLMALANRLVQNGDMFADVTLSAAVTDIEHTVDFLKQKLECPVNMNDGDERHNIGVSKDLSVVVEEIRSTSSPGQPLSERFRGLVTQHDKTRCIAAVVFEDLWNGSAGWKPSKTLWDMVIYVWRNAPDFFGDYDSDLEIIEDYSRWTQRYFDDQRNSLRFNFCLRRLCHLVMVYEYLHGEEASVKKSTPAQPPCSNRSSCVEAPRATKPNRGFLSRFAIIVCVALTVAVSIYLFGARNGGGCSEAVAIQPGADQIASEQSSPIQPRQAMPEIATGLFAETVERDEVRKQDTRSNEVVKSTIALQESAPQARKAPIRRSGSVANKQ